MEIRKIGDFIICPIPADSELDPVEIEKITSHTHNTWQHDRFDPEKEKIQFRARKQNW